MKYLLAILLSGCAVPDRVNDGITGPHGHAPSVAAMCLHPGLRLPSAPFDGVTVEYGASNYTYRDSITVTSDNENVLAHEFIHVALSRYLPHVADHHQWMRQHGACLGGCESMFQNGGCE